MKKLYPFVFDEKRVLYSTDFENGLNGWMARDPEPDHFDYGKYNVNVELTDEEAYSGKKYMKISGRVKCWNGAILDITKYLNESIFKYEALAWVKVREGLEPCRVCMSIQKSFQVGGVDFPEYMHWDDYSKAPNYILSKYRFPTTSTEPVKEFWETAYPQGYKTDDGWVLLRGVINIRKSHYDSVHVFFETSEGKVLTHDIYVDNFTLLKGE